MTRDDGEPTPAPPVPPGRVYQDPWWQLGRFLLGSAARAFFRERVAGVEHLPRSGGAILAANHVSVLDPIFLALAASRRGRTVRFLTVADAFETPFVGWGLRRIRQIPVRRGAGDLAALEVAIRVVGSGALAGVFPEGRMGTGEKLLPGRRGAARLAAATGAPLVPAAVWGAQRRWPRTGVTTRPPLRPVVGVTFGRPLLAAEFDDARALTEGLMTAIAEQVALARRLAGR